MRFRNATTDAILLIYIQLMSCHAILPRSILKQMGTAYEIEHAEPRRLRRSHLTYDLPARTRQAQHP